MENKLGFAEKVQYIKIFIHIEKLFLIIAEK